MLFCLLFNLHLTNFKYKLYLPQVKEICQDLVLTAEGVKEVCDSLQEEINRGLAKDSNPEATIKCFPTYVRELPNGKGEPNISHVIITDTLQPRDCNVIQV